jgi:signal peptidase
VAGHPQAAPRPHRRTIRRALGWLELVVVALVLVFWFIELRPQGMGGPASYALVNGRSMLPKYHTGDVVIVHRHAHYEVGQVVAYIVPKGSVGAGAQVIHRLIGGNARTGFIVQGDNRTAPDIWRPKESEIVGAAWLHIPKFGVVVKLLHTPIFLAGLAALIAVGSVLTHTPKRRKEEGVPEPATAATASASLDPAPVEVLAAYAGSRLMIPAGDPPPEGVPLCSRGCHILLLGARFDPHNGDAVVVAEDEPQPSVDAPPTVPAEPAEPAFADPATWPFWAFRAGPEHRFAEYELAPAYRVSDPPPIDFAQLEREIHDAVRSNADVRETVQQLVGAIGTYGEHLRSHTEVLQNLAAATGDLRGTTLEMRAFLASLTALLTRMSDTGTPSIEG